MAKLTVPPKTRIQSLIRETVIATILFTLAAAILLLILRARSLPTICGLVALQTLILVQLVLLYHDCLHSALFRSRIAHVFLGRLIGSAFFWPFHFLRDSHLRHHRNAGLVEDDPEVLHFSEAAARESRVRYLLSWLARSPLGLFLFTPILQLDHFARWAREQLRSPNQAILKATLIDFLWMAAFWIPLNFWLYSQNGLLKGFFVGVLIPEVIAMALVYWVAKPLHTDMLGSPAPELGHQERVFAVARTFDTNALMRFLFCNLNYHIEHHLFPTISRWELGKHSRAIRSDLTRTQRSGHAFIAIHKSYFKWTLAFIAHGTKYNSIRSVAELRRSYVRYRDV